jgi:hypothetical protein
VYLLYFKPVIKNFASYNAKNCFLCFRKIYDLKTILGFGIASVEKLNVPNVIVLYRRGINPPHRIKSISMSTFTAEEVDSLRMRGNAWCAR